MSVQFIFRAIIVEHIANNFQFFLMCFEFLVAVHGFVCLFWFFLGGGCFSSPHPHPLFEDVKSNLGMFKMLFSNKASLFLCSIVFHMYSLKGIILLYSLKIMIANYSPLVKEKTQRFLTNNTCRNTQEITKLLSSLRKWTPHLSSDWTLKNWLFFVCFKFLISWIETFGNQRNDLHCFVAQWQKELALWCPWLNSLLESSAWLCWNYASGLAPRYSRKQKNGCWNLLVSLDCNQISLTMGVGTTTFF